MRPTLLTPHAPGSSLRFRGNPGKPIPAIRGALETAHVNSPELPSAAASATSLPVRPDPAPPAGPSDDPGPGSDDPGPGPDHLAGPVAPTARAAGAHQPTVRARRPS